uniref:Uncharacterized protein n=1 Tax=Heterorhabditis bacteriophora TaxID=37862 RepID=A0A1I7WJH1_HETBA
MQSIMPKINKKDLTNFDSMPLRKTFEFVSQEDLVKLVNYLNVIRLLAYKIFLDIFYLLHIIVLKYKSLLLLFLVIVAMNIPDLNL